MGLQSAMTTALTGLQAAETTIDVVGNNVANANTVGFKESEAVFATQFLQTQSIGSAPSNALGGTNPRQIGLGVKVAEIAPDFTQGTIEISANPLDLAIQGDGFLIVQGSQGEQFYTRNGQLNVNAQNEIVTTGGNRVLGYGVDDEFNILETQLTALTVPIGAAAVASATENVFLAGNFSPEATVADTAGVTESAILTDGTIEVPDGTPVSFSTLLPPGTTGTTGAATTGGTVAPSTYTYKMTFSNGTDETPPTGQFGSTTIAVADNAVQLSGLSLPPTSNPSFASYTEQRIYRSDGTGPFTLVGQQPAATTFLDTAAAGTTVLDDSAVNQVPYSYYFTFYNTTDLVESRPSKKLGPYAVSDAGRRVQLENIPQPTPTADNGNFDAIRIYRNTEGSNDTFYLVDEVLAGTIDYVDQIPDATIEAGGQVIDLEGPPITPGLALVEVVSRDGANYSNLFEEGTLSFRGTKGERDLATKDLTITSSTTVQDLIEFMDEAIGIFPGSTDPSFPLPGNPGGEVTTDGRIRFTSNFGEENEISIDLSAFQITPTGETVSDSVPLQFVTVLGSATSELGQGATTDFIVFDSLGIPITVRVSTYLEEKTGNSFSYRWMATSDDNQPDTPFGVDTTAGTGLVTFDGNGDLVSVSQSTVTVDRRESPSASPLQFELDFSRVSGLPPAGTEAAFNSNLAAVQQDGLPPGVLTNFVIAEDGTVRGIFNNGSERPVGRLQLARFANNAGLEQLGENLFGVGVNSGLAVIGDPGGQGLGTLTGGAVELSNTDIGQNLIELILASTQYRGNARVISAAQELLDELLALRR